MLKNLLEDWAAGKIRNLSSVAGIVSWWGVKAPRYHMAVKNLNKDVILAFVGILFSIAKIWFHKKATFHPFWFFLKVATSFYLYFACIDYLAYLTVKSQLNYAFD